MSKEKSIIRNGNHFIYLDNTGWVLIDGPWFDMLPSQLKIMRYYVRMYSPPDCNAYLEPPPIPEFVEFKEMIWEKLNWLPCYTIVNDDFRLSFKYKEFVYKYRYKVGWRIHPGGQLPVYFNALDWYPEMEFDLHLA